MAKADLDELRARAMRLLKSVGPVEPEEVHGDPDEDDHLRLELVVVKAALRSERENAIELQARIEELTALLEAEQRRSTAFKADRDRWAARAETLALPLFQERTRFEDEDDEPRRLRRVA
jgi:uncharacterized protein YlxW (UPF0749 family)